MTFANDYSYLLCKIEWLVYTSDKHTWRCLGRTRCRAPWDSSYWSPLWLPRQPGSGTGTWAGPDWSVAACEPASSDVACTPARPYKTLQETNILIGSEQASFLKLYIHTMQKRTWNGTRSNLPECWRTVGSCVLGWLRRAAPAGTASGHRPPPSCPRRRSGRRPPCARTTSWCAPRPARSRLYGKYPRGPILQNKQKQKFQGVKNFTSVTCWTV